MKQPIPTDRQALHKKKLRVLLLDGALIGILLAVVFLAQAAISSSKKNAGALALDVTQTPTATGTPFGGGRTATIAEVRNQARVRFNANAPDEVFAAAGQLLTVGAQVRTLAASGVTLTTSEGTVIRVSEMSFFILNELSPNTGNPLTRLQLFVGKVWIILNGGAVEVETPVGVGAVRGSLMSVSYQPGMGEIKETCLEGTCEAIIGGVVYRIGQGSQLTYPPFPPRFEIIDSGQYEEWLKQFPNESSPFIPATATPRPDGDGDGVPDAVDNCPTAFNSDQADSNGDGIGNICAANLFTPGPTSAPTATPAPTATEEEG